MRDFMGQVESTLPAPEPSDLISWTPVDAVIQDGKPVIEWMDLKAIEFTEPFFHQTIERARAAGTTNRLVTEFDVLLRAEKVFNSLEPSGIIFHSSRCGSTLVANACRAVRGSIVIAEAPVLDKIICRFFTDANSEAKTLLYKLFIKAAVAALGQRRSGNERRLFIKLGCTSTLQIAHLRSIWPKVPFVFLYRDPLEIVVSNVKTIPEWMCFDSNLETAAAIGGVETSALSNMTHEEFCARALGRYFEEAARNREALTLFVNYANLNFEKLVSVLSFMNAEPSQEEIDVIRTISVLYSKDSTQSRSFEADADSKRALASNAAIEMVNRWARDSFEALERQTHWNS
jgi:hypothetical protein